MGDIKHPIPFERKPSQTKVQQKVLKKQKSPKRIVKRKQQREDMGESSSNTQAYFGQSGTLRSSEVGAGVSEMI
jgi:hypothetical protein